MEKKKIIFMVLFVVLGIGAAVGLSLIENKGSGEHAALAQCITDSDAKFYGAFWCPNCTDQKRAFKQSAKLLPYIECSNPDRTQNALCTEADIQGYPTWEFADGSRVSGVLSTETLAGLTQCSVPEETPAPTDE